MAENHQKRCNPAIHPVSGAIIFSHLGMAKNMHGTRLPWYEAPTYDTSSLDRSQPVYRNRPAVGPRSADRRIAPLKGSAARSGHSGPAGHARWAGSGPRPTGGALRFLRPAAAATATTAAPAPAAAVRPATRRCTALRSARGTDRQARTVRDRARGTGTLQRPQPAG